MTRDTERIWEEFGGALRGFILSRVRDRETTEDILQDVFLKIHFGIATLESREKLQPWLFAIARNAMIDRLRKRRDDLSMEELSEDLAVESSGPVSSPHDFEPCLRALAKRLPERYREPFLLSELDGITQKEVGEKLGLSVSGAKSRVQRGREMMKDLLLDCCHFEFDRNGDIEEVRPKSFEAQECFDRSDCSVH